MPEQHQDETRDYIYIEQTYTIRPTGPGCYEVMLGEHRGYLGINLQGTKYAPYAYTTEPWQASPDGVRDGVPCSSNLPSALNHLCSKLFEDSETQRMQALFDAATTAVEFQAGMEAILQQPQD